MVKRVDASRSEARKSDIKEVARVRKSSCRISLTNRRSKGSFRRATPSRRAARYKITAGPTRPAVWLAPLRSRLLVLIPSPAQHTHSLLSSSARRTAHRSTLDPYRPSAPPHQPRSTDSLDDPSPSFDTSRRNGDTARCCSQHSFPLPSRSPRLSPWRSQTTAKRRPSRRASLRNAPRAWHRCTRRVPSLVRLLHTFACAKKRMGVSGARRVSPECHTDVSHVQQEPLR